MGSPHFIKKCSSCGIPKPVGDFYPSPGGRRGRDAYCKECRRDRDRARSASRSKMVLRMKAKDPFYYRRKKLLKMYGITHEQYEQMYAKQRGLCAICLKPEARCLYGGLSKLVVDHNHKTGRVRALLCHRCNVALGTVENEEFVKKALAYLERYDEAALSTAFMIQETKRLDGGAP